MRKPLAFALLIICCKAVNGQLLPEGPVVIPSPEAAGFMKSGNVPVSDYTGTANVSIPLFNIKDGPINLPVSLSYNTSGIRIEEEATWVGLGFNLNTGGQITRAIRGGDIFCTIRHMSTTSTLLPRK